MTADIILEDDAVRVTDGNLEVTGGRLILSRGFRLRQGDDSIEMFNSGSIYVRGVDDTTKIYSSYILTSKVLAQKVRAGEILSSNVQIGAGRPDEPGDAGILSLEDGYGNETIKADGKHGNLYLGGNGEDGDLLVHNQEGGLTVGINGRSGNVTCGGAGTDGDLILLDSDARRLIFLDAGETGEVDESVTIYADGKEADLVIGRRLNDGSVTLLDQSGEARVRIGGYRDPDDATGSTVEPDEVHQFGGEVGATRVRMDMLGSLMLGGDGEAGNVRLRQGDALQTIELAAASSSIRVGHPDGPEAGKLTVIDEYGSVGVELENTDVIAGAVKAGRISNPTAFRPQHAVIADHIGVRVGRMDSSDNYQETARIASDGKITASDLEIGTIQSLLQTIQDLQQRIQALENNGP